MSRKRKRARGKSTREQAPQERVVQERVVLEEVESAQDPVGSGAEPAGEPLWRAVAREPIALGLALIVFCRPWWDGMTYPSFNTYFLWAIVVLTALWAARLLLRGEPIRFALPVGLLTLFFCIAFLTGLDTVQVHLTYRALLFWVGHLFLFLLCTNALRSPLAIGIVLGAFVLSSTANALWSIIHFEYMLPLMREEVADPAVRQYFFGTTELGPDLRHRLEMNRAFGTLLQPNALAAFLILGIPYAAGEAWPTFLKWRKALAGGGGEEGGSAQERLRVSAAVGVIAWFLTIASATFIYPYLLLVIKRDLNWMDHTVQSLFYLGVLPIAMAGLCVFLTRRIGVRGLRLTLQSCVLPMMFIAEVAALWLTYSRGGFIALSAAVTLAAALYALGSGKIGRVGPWARGAAACLLIALAAASFAGPHGWAQDAPGVGNAPPAFQEGIRVEGLDFSTKDLVNPNTFRIRLTYWKVGLIMAKDNLWTGVGLGNFGTVYAKYQYLGAGPVQAAHNDYLQMFCETGVFGLLAFCAFWGYFCLWGGRRILREKNAAHRWLLAGLYASVMAFLIHSLVDFNFYNPTLASIAFFMAGLFYARSAQLDPTEQAPSTKKKWVYQAVALPILVVVAFATGAAMRAYIIDFELTEGGLWRKVTHVGDRFAMRSQVNMASFILRDVSQRGGNSRNALYRPVADVALLIDDRKTIEDFGVIRVHRRPGDASSLRPLGRDEPIPPTAWVFFHNVEKARKAAVQWSELHLERLKLIDDIYPFIPEVAMTIFEWYDLLQSQTDDPEKRREYVLECLRWAEKGVERNPEQAWFRNWHAKALWLCGKTGEAAESLDYYYAGLEEYRKACELFDISPFAWGQYGTAQKKLGKALVDAGNVDEGEQMIENGKMALARSKELDAFSM